MSIYTLMWLWFWFLFGAMTYMAKRAFYLIKGPNPVANNFKEFLQVAGIPLFFRLVVDSAFYWAMFTPQIAQAGFAWLGLEKFAGIIAVITKFAVCSLGFGLIIDTLADWVIGTLVSRIPLFSGWWAQMPAPLPKSQVENPPTSADRQKQVP
jgi:hypothetical protein